ncbi:MAG: type II toxin-antitoxin system YafQ family toxin [bacterium]|nr:type II toxin-antitoxin system YafQ family toxin [bacterium]
MLIFKNTNQFKKDLKRILKSGKNVIKFREVAEKLIHEIPLENKYRDHKLIGKYTGHRECHLEPDWLLIYYITTDTITFVRTGTHADLFKM